MRLQQVAEMGPILRFRPVPDVTSHAAQTLHVLSGGGLILSGGCDLYDSAKRGAVLATTF